MSCSDSYLAMHNVYTAFQEWVHASMYRMHAEEDSKCNKACMHASHAMES